MLEAKDARAASDLLFDCWTQGRRIDALPPELRPATRAEGYAIQAYIEERSSGPIVGWKIAATSEAGQAHIGVDGPMAGRILSERVLTSGASTPLGDNHMKVGELEIAFRMGQDLPARTAPYGLEETLAAVETILPTIELPDSRYEDFVTAGAPQLIADNSCAHLFVIGEDAEIDWRALDLVHYRTHGCVSARYERDGKGGNVLGDPRLALVWLANELSQNGLTLKAGEIVSTGTTLTPLEIEAGDEIFGDFGALGTLSVHLV